MKKNNVTFFLIGNSFFRIMKIYTLLVSITLIKVMALDGYSQKLSLHLKDVELKEVLSAIENKSEYKFFYNSYLINSSEKRDIKVNNAEVKDVLDGLFKGTVINYKVLDKQIVLFSKSKEYKKILDSSFFRARDSIFRSNILNNTAINSVGVDDLFDQGVKVSGAVKDEEGSPFPGVTVVVKGTIFGVETDYDGRFEINAQKGNILLFSFTGYKSQEVIYNGQKEINITLKEEANLLEEVIVTGYAKQQKERVTGSVETIKVENLINNPRTTIQESIQGNISGVQVVSSSGQPGSTPNVRIRGIGSFESASPLYVIDGLQTKSASVMTTLNPNDIENVTVLKDASATSIYGTSGSNGVIVVTTKSGKKGRTRINVSSQTGFSTPTIAEKFKPLNTTEFQELFIEGVRNANLASTNSEALTYLTDRGFNPEVNTDWLDLLTQNATFQQHNVSVSGGGEKTSYYLSGGFYKQEAVILNSNLERFNFLLKGSHDISDKAKVSSSISFSKNTSNVRPDAGAFANPVRAIYRLRPDISPYNEDGSYNLGFNGTHNPVAQAENEIRKNIRNRVAGVLDFSYKFNDYLTYEGKLTAGFNFTDNFERLPSGYGSGRHVNGRGDQEGQYLTRYLMRNLIRFDYSFGEKHDITSFAGYEVQKINSKSYNLRVENIPDEFEDLAAGATPSQASESRSIEGKNSLFFNTEYAYDKKYLLSGSIRRDGSSKFGPKNKHGVFWSMGLGWNISKESFMNSVNFVDDLKLRASYGKIGNDGIGNNRFITILSSGSDYNGQVASGLSIGNPDIKWEDSFPLDIGLDYSLFNGRISGSFDWYKRVGEDLLMSAPVSGLNGTYTLTSNVASTENKGFEITLNTRNVESNTNGFSWRTNFTFSRNTNKVTKLINNNAPQEGSTSIRAVGEDFYTFYLPIYAGVDPLNGDALWYKDETKSEVTNNYGDAKQAIVGKATPDFYAGLRNTFSYKNISLNVQFYTSWGGKIYDTWSRFTNSDGSRSLSTSGNVSRGTYERRWQQPGDITDVPRFVYGNTQSGRSSMSSSRFVYDGSYVRLREAELAYTFGEDLKSHLGISSLRVFLKGNNLWTYVKDKRLERDPEAGIDGRLNQEIPIGRTVFLGVNVSF
ncbi:TonB-linked outer membrane protein, SusC/RagA family [Tenacibaculum sp. MAR_2009_124]|uniref:TonB-dependent receptor n=1 Tax=Tenacibaculum sp. MAR_2009_124 TaxID=1250059 RepID=UPI000898F07E|nr:TonB-dependent receptor [Tenacibaculum sp. MAR_2009_124]SEB74823.1 TonB-linked outer membrane protein, SusC/RagA family [Tenacibaculum sp. MAR_2009_124]